MPLAAVVAPDMNSPQNSITPADYASPEQIDRNLERLRKIPDRGRTGNLLADWDAQERHAAQERRRLEWEEIDRRDALRAESETGAGLVLDGWVGSVEAPAPVAPAAPQAAFDFHARGDDLPLFAT